MDTPEKLRAAIEGGIQSNLSFRDPGYDFMLGKLWTVLFEATSALRNSTEAQDIKKFDDKRFTCMLMLTNCIVDAHASYQSLRHGFDRAAAIISRGMLENMAVVVAMHSDDTNQIFEDYRSDKFDIPSAITKAKNHFPEFGKLYGILSNKFAHEPYDSIGRAFIQQDKTTTLLLVPPIGRSDFKVQFVLLLNLASLVALLGEVIEWVFARLIPPRIFWELEGERLKSKKCPAKEALKEMAEKLESILPPRAK